MQDHMGNIDRDKNFRKRAKENARNRKHSNRNEKC